MQIVDFIPIKIESTLDWSLVLALLAALAYYFGKLVNEIKPTKETEFSNYLEGGIYLIMFIILPALILYTVFNENIFPTIPLLYALVGQIILTWYLSKRLMVYRIEEVKLKDQVDKLTVAKSKEVFSKLNLPDTEKNITRGMNVYSSVFFKPLPGLALFIFIALEYWFTGSVVLSGTKVIISFFSLLMLILGVSTIAIIWSWGNVQQYPKVTICLVNGEKFSGNLRKIDSGYVSIFEGGKVYHFKDNNVLYIKSDVQKKKKA